ncbi:MAG: hypothetical protein D3921_01130 [Candidatus Electrothrix sp. AW1]|nr:hypothetical protein [Candidatus Electrothrix gigas]
MQTIALSEEEVETVLNLVREQREFIEAIKKAAPVALAMDKADIEIQEKEKVLEETQQEDERKKLGKEIKELHRVFKLLKWLKVCRQAVFSEAKFSIFPMPRSGRESTFPSLISIALKPWATFARSWVTLWKRK